ncbi:MAG: FecR family protein [Bacteroidales bacterium]|nr:FecR family protein [Bacteroidales bacterium]
MDNRSPKKNIDTTSSKHKENLTGMDKTLFQWLSENPGQEDLYYEYVDIWQASSLLKKKEKYDRNFAWNDLKKKLKKKNEERINKRRRAIAYFSIAAGIALLIAFGTYKIMIKADLPDIVAYQEMNVPYGSRSEITLPDGTQVWLNAGSKIRYSSSYNITNREVWMEGECYFKVFPGNIHQFSVVAPGIRIIAHGTEFNIKAYPDEKFIEATLVEGLVEIHTSQKGKTKKQEIILSSNQTAYFSKTAASKNSDGAVNQGQRKKEEELISSANVDLKKIMNNPSPELQTSWKDGKLIVQKEKLSTLARKLERRYNVRIEFADSNSQNYIFSGILVNETLEQVLNIIKLTSPIQYTVEGSTITLREDAELRKRLN